MSSHQKILQDLFRQLRKEAGLSQKDLADCLSRPQSFVSKYETGERKLDLLEIREICHHLHLDLLTFVQRFEQMLIEDDATESTISPAK